jgi:hypothetical protein
MITKDTDFSNRILVSTPPPWLPVGPKVPTLGRNELSRLMFSKKFNRRWTGFAQMKMRSDLSAMNHGSRTMAD